MALIAGLLMGRRNPNAIAESFAMDPLRKLVVGSPATREGAASLPSSVSGTAWGVGDKVMLAYAVGIHKSQGAAFPAVVIPVRPQHDAMLARKRLYTGVTQGPEAGGPGGQQKAVALAVRGVKDQFRWSKLREWLNT